MFGTNSILKKTIIFLFVTVLCILLSDCSKQSTNAENNKDKNQKRQSYYKHDSEFITEDNGKLEKSPFIVKGVIKGPFSMPIHKVIWHRDNNRFLLIDNNGTLYECDKDNRTFRYLYKAIDPRNSEKIFNAIYTLDNKYIFAVRTYLDVNDIKAIIFMTDAGPLSSLHVWGLNKKEELFRRDYKRGTSYVFYPFKTTEKGRIEEIATKSDIIYSGDAVEFFKENYQVIYSDRLNISYNQKYYTIFKANENIIYGGEWIDGSIDWRKEDKNRVYNSEVLFSEKYKLFGYMNSYDYEDTFEIRSCIDGDLKYRLRIPDNIGFKYLIKVSEDNLGIIGENNLLYLIDIINPGINDYVNLSDFELVKVCWHNSYSPQISFDNQGKEFIIADNKGNLVIAEMKE